MATAELQRQLVTAAQQGDYKQVKRLLQQGAKANTYVDKYRPILHGVLAWCDEETLRYRFHDYAEVIKALVHAGASLEARDVLGNTALMQACLYGQLPIAKLLLHLGANPNAANEDGETPLTAASHLGPAEAVRELIRRGADVNHRTRYGYTPLMFAAGRACAQSVRYLLEAGADADAVHPEGGFSALVLGACSGLSVEMMCALVRRMRHPVLRRQQIEQAMAEARVRGRWEIVECLEALREQLG